MAELYLPNAGNWINALEAGQEASMTRKKRQATTSAAGLMSSGNYAGAAKAIMPYDIGSGIQLQKYGTEQTKDARRKEVAKQFQTDQPGALNAALEIDPEFHKELSGIADKSKLEKAQKFGGILRGIGNEPEDQWDDLILANRAALESLDIAPADIDAFVQAAPEQRRVMMSTLLTRADMLDKFLGDRDKAADNQRADAQDAETRRHNRVGEGNAAGQLSLSRQREARVAAGGGDDEWEEF